ncbi:hypothetical protein NFI96_031538 [Prochilodus magdalenae]|nr:hypothetical protein NFI96_031538 [Prochilodus magdalenae]
MRVLKESKSLFPVYMCIYVCCVCYVFCVCVCVMYVSAVYVWGPDEENRRRDRLKSEETHRKQRSGESTDRRHREEERDERREKQRERDSTRERAKHRDPERDREEQRRREERERRKERERDGEKRGSERRADRDEKENRDKEKERRRERYKDRDREGDSGRNREREKERHRDREERDRLKDREKERYREKERERDQDREREKQKEKDRDKDRERERRRAEREKERRRDKEESRDVEEKQREKERRERHREREERHRGEERERKEKHVYGEISGHVDREERRERRRREKERYEAGVGSLDDTREAGRRHGERDKARDGEERDKRREKRHEESKKSSADQRHSENKLRNTEEEVENEVVEDDAEAAEDYGNGDYEEDFEDYEEDFEEMEEEEEDKGGEENKNTERREQRELSPRRREEIEAIKRAMQKENELVSSSYSQPPNRKAEPPQKDSEGHSKKGHTHGRVIDFAAARQREVNQQAADKQKKRSAELLRLIDLDFSVTECLLDLPPVSEYDMYIKSFGMANTKQAYVQCNEDNTDRDTQTEETDTTDKWTQHPPETNNACGGPKVSQNASDESLARMSVDSKRLATFLRSAAQVMAVLLEENRAESNPVKKLHSKTDTLSFSDGCLHLNTSLPFLHGRQVTLLHFSQVQTHTLLSVHSPCSGSSGVRLDGKTLICVWNIWEPSAPQSMLAYEAEVRCCCFSPGKSTLVFAGTAVGSVVLWDLREHSGFHSSLKVGGEEWTLRHPTFSTDAVLSEAGHFSSVVSVEPVLVNAEPGIKGPHLPDQEESLGLSFQLASLDENGLLNVWVVIELPKADDSGSQTDLGLRPGGKVKLLHSSCIQTSERLSSREVKGVTPSLSILLKFLPSDSNHYFVGTSMGLVRRGTRHGLRVIPKLYRSEDGERPAEVTALDFCPSGEPFFLVGCSDGTVRLHSVLHEEPVLEWSTGSGDAPVLAVQWSKTRPSVFCILDAASVLHIWDLTERDSAAVVTESFATDR